MSVSGMCRSQGRYGTLGPFDTVVAGMTEPADRIGRRAPCPPQRPTRDTSGGHRPMRVVATGEVPGRDLHRESDHQATHEGRHQREPVNDRAH